MIVQQTLANGTNIVIGPNWTRITLPCGAVVEGCPTPDQAETAEQLGYGDDLAAMCRDHDPLHARLADWLGLPHSYSLMEAAGRGVDPHLARLEETAVMALQELKRKAHERASS